jgi:hypothetical protein
MLNRLLLIVACIPLHACSLFAEVQEGVYEFTPIELAGADRQSVEREKRDFLSLENIKAGSGSIAAWNRKIGAAIEVRYADGTLVYRGDVLAYIGLRGGIGLHNNIPHLLPFIKEESSSD